MKILIAPDKFRGSLRADEVAEAMKKGVLLANQHASVETCELADGGEGTAELLIKSFGGDWQEVSVNDPLGRPIIGRYGLSADRQVAFIEMASASGLALLQPEERNPLLTSTYGTGQLIRHAIEQGVNQIYLGIGGSATNDAGIGMAAALGYVFLDQSGNHIEPIGGNMQHISHIDSSNVLPQLATITCTVLSDVTNPLTGPEGAAYVYGPQKGADESMVKLLDKGLVQFNTVMTKWLGEDLSNHPGAGAAGGLGIGAMWFLKANLQSGVRTLLTLLGIEKHIQEADLVITGEGKIDVQTLSGKAIGGLAQVCKQYQKPLIVISGAMLLTPAQIQQLGVTCAVSILNRPVTEQIAYQEAYDRVMEATFNLVRLFSFRSI